MWNTSQLSLKSVSASIMVSESGEWRIPINKQSMHRTKEKDELEPERPARVQVEGFGKAAGGGGSGGE